MTDFKNKKGEYVIPSCPICRRTLEAKPVKNPLHHNAYRCDNCNKTFEIRDHTIEYQEEGD